MKERKRRSGAQEKALAADLYARRNEATDWEKTAADAEIHPHRAVVTSLRLPVGEFVAVQRAAKSAGQTVSEFIRNAIAAKLRGRLVVNAVQISTGSSQARSQATVYVSALEGGDTENPGPDRMEAILYSNL